MYELSFLIHSRLGNSLYLGYICVSLQKEYE